MQTPAKTEAIRALNDAFRTANGATYNVTKGIRERGLQFTMRAMRGVHQFCEFTEDNDPWGEHDFGAFDVDGAKLFWKIDYYDRASFGTESGRGSAAPEDESQTKRVLTVMLAEEY